MDLHLAHRLLPQETSIRPFKNANRNPISPDMNDPKNSAEVPHVLCLGGGYVAIHLAKSLRSWIKRGRVRLTVVDQDNFQCFHGLIPDMITGKLQPTETLSASRKLFAPGDFVNAEVEEILHEKKQVVVSRFLDGRQLTLEYDQLVIALGSTENLGRFPGLAEHSFRLKAYSACLAVRNQFISMLELADMEPEPEERRRLLGFVIVGGNYAGVEVAGELREYLPAVARKHFPNIRLEEIRIHLVVSGDHILPELNAEMPGLVQYAARQLETDPHLKILYKTRLASATVEEAVLDNGERLPARTIIGCAGMSTVPVLKDLPFERDERDRIKTDVHARVPGTCGVWSGGDCAAVPLAGGGYAPGLAIWAMTVGRLIGQNIKRDMSGKALKPYRFNGLGDACVLGHRKAVAHLKGVAFKGVLAWLTWRAFMIIYLPSPEKKLRVLWSWVTAPFFGRDLINMRVHQPLDLTPVLFEPGQEVIRKGDVGNSLFIVQEGEVEVVDDESPESEPIAVLGQGQHFGEIAVFRNCTRTATVRARTRVKLLQVRREAATALGDTVQSFGQEIRQQPTSESHTPSHES